MLAFHGNAALKDQYIARVEAHARADEIIRGTGYERLGQGRSRGCAVGCTLNAYDHSLYPVELGVPLELAHLEDALFEGMPAPAAMMWPREFLEAIPVGADLSGVWPRFAVWLLRDIRPLALPDGQEAIDAVVSLFESDVPHGDERWAEAARAAARAAEAAAAWAAEAAARAAEVAAEARAAAEAWAASEARAAWAAARAAWAWAAEAWAAEAWAAEAAAHYRQSRALLALLRSAPVAS